MRTRKDLQLPLPLPFREREFVAPAYVVIDGKAVSYTIKRSARRRTISLRIDEAGLRVGAPLDASRGAVERVLQRHAAWVVEKLGEWSGRRTKAVTWRDGETLMLKGAPIVLRCSPQATKADIREDAIVAPGLDTERHVVAALREAALACYAERVAHYCGLLGVPTPQVRLSSARTRWGSCHIEGRILLNWRMIQMPMTLVDYVVAHEVAHLEEMNHSRRFWAVVARLEPQYGERRREIHREGHRYLVV